MSTVTYVLAIIFMGLVAIVLVRGLYNMTRGDNPSLSNRLMQMRILLQAVALILIMLTLWLTGGGRPA
ncbi:twin transmembrane helix small protein [Rhizobium sp. HT1-10]|uniref:twin transmembrane helix small protein n=1 Tax=Rhizobium sp. HT1-10 TaxID=3111638 RepID=UPI003C297BE2